MLKQYFALQPDFPGGMDSTLTKSLKNYFRQKPAIFLPAILHCSYTQIWINENNKKDNSATLPLIIAPIYPAMQILMTLFLSKL